MCSVLPQLPISIHYYYDYIMDEPFLSILHVIIAFHVRPEAHQALADSRAAAAEAPKNGLSGYNFRRFAARFADLVEQNEWYHWIQRGQEHGKPLNRLYICGISKI